MSQPTSRFRRDPTRFPAPASRADTTAVDFFDKARSVAVAVLAVAGALAIGGSLADWVVISPPPPVRADVDFGDAKLEGTEASEPFTGIEAGDGRWSLAAGVVMILAGALLLIRRRAVYGWIALLATVVIGSIAFADYRAIGDLSSALSRRMDVVGEARPAVGITLVAAAAIIGLIGSAAGIAATPRSQD